MSARDRIIADLRASIDGIERRPALAGRAGPDSLAAGAAPQVTPGSLTEILFEGTRDAGAALGFSLMQARGLVTPERPVTLFLQMRNAAQEIGLPYGPGLLGYGFDPQGLAVVRTDTITELLWAMEEAVGCRSVAAVMGDVARGHAQLDFTASRRLAMRAESFGTAVFVLRAGAGREASAARFRFHVAAETSAETPFDARAPGDPRYRVTLEKGGRAAGGATGQDASGRDFWLLEWTENGLVADDSGRTSRTGSGRAKTLSGARAAGLGDRLSQTA